MLQCCIVMCRLHTAAGHETKMCIFLYCLPFSLNLFQLPFNKTFVLQVCKPNPINPSTSPPVVFNRISIFSKMSDYSINWSTSRILPLFKVGWKAASKKRPLTIIIGNVTEKHQRRSHPLEQPAYLTNWKNSSNKTDHELTFHQYQTPCSLPSSLKMEVFQKQQQVL